ncbi:glycosyltransferase [Psychromonas arctica]|uniref:glycosyltransferase n=1 Tax=Psychromonas arctica TaxID=168275 RepID=UPI002FD55C16
MNVIAIVVTYKRSKLLRKVLNSLKDQSLKPSKVIVIDNNSGDETCAVVNEFSRYDDSFFYYNTNCNLGGAGGFHCGFEIAKKYNYDYLWLMDDDLLPAKNCLEYLLFNTPIDIVQPTRFDQNGICVEMSPVVYDLNKVFCKNPKLYSVADIYSSLKEKELINIATVPFEGPLISKKVVETIGFPNPLFFITGDDTDYSLRAIRSGFTIKCSLKARATRLLIHNQSDDLFTWKGYFILRNHFYILRNYGDNIFVRNRSVIILFYIAIKASFKVNFKALRTVFSAYVDSSKLNNNERHKP